MGIQYLLVAGSIALAVLLLRHHGTIYTSATSKIAFMLFLLFGMVAALWPQVVTVMAQGLGVGRGTDLLVYALVVGLALTSLHSYLRFKDLEDRHVRLARNIALQFSRSPHIPSVDRRGIDRASDAEDVTTGTCEVGSAAPHTDTSTSPSSSSYQH